MFWHFEGNVDHERKHVHTMLRQIPNTAVLLCVAIAVTYFFMSYSIGTGVLKIGRNQNSKVLKRKKIGWNDNDAQRLLIPPDSVLSNMPEGRRRELFWRYTNRIQTLCTDIVRVGSIYDGGKEVCLDSEHEPKAPCLVYSFGINWQFDFDLDINKYCGCEVHCFDPSMESPDMKIKDNIWFYNIGLDNKTWVNEDGWKMKTFNQIRQELKHENTKINILKLDIEYYEWYTLPQLVNSGALNDVDQLLVEYHTYGTSIEHLRLLRDLYNIGFRSFMRERTKGCPNHPPLWGNSDCIEVSYVKVGDS